MVRTYLTPPGCSVPFWLASHVLVGLRRAFTSPDYTFVVEETPHIDNVQCNPGLRRARLACDTNFDPAPALVAAWSGRARLR